MKYIVQDFTFYEYPKKRNRGLHGLFFTVIENVKKVSFSLVKEFSVIHK